jgi:hypothetical protein
MGALAVIVIRNIEIACPSRVQYVQHRGGFMNIHERFRAVLRAIVDIAHELCAESEKIAVRAALTFALLYGVWHFLLVLMH